MVLAGNAFVLVSTQVALPHPHSVSPLEGEKTLRWRCGG